ncbi:unannotated protein [freshwater metagenome]|uniref:Unannotated protein n=1 Tax=freshwater metagenome TaxID=449393 RepID=A0A6J6BHF5_9ZZZZ|nr:hypothetical protein [Actinomycetota bacterium]
MIDRAAELLVILEQSRDLGFLGPGPVAAQISHAEGFLPFLLSDRETELASRKILDLGSGGGLPGLVLALALPTSEFVLVDSNQRRCSFLQSAIEQLLITDRVRVALGRAEELARDPSLRASCEVVVSRSFGPPAVTAECAIGFLSGPGAQVLISEPPEDQPRRWPEEGLEKLGLAIGSRETHGLATIQQLLMVAPCPEKFPRRVGIPAKRPVF